MRLATFSTQEDLDHRIGVVDAAGDSVVEVHRGSVLDLIEQWDTYESAVTAATEAGVPRPIDMVELHAPIEPRRNVLCVGKNYRDHIAEMAKQTGPAPDRPVIFTKAPTAVTGPGASIPSHQGLTAKLDYEAELGVVIGRGGVGIAPSDAWSHVWGYTVVNDVTARDLQQAHGQWFLGKSLDGACPMGPWIVTADDFDPAAARITCHVNGELRQSATTDQLIFDIPTLIATLSAGMTLLPGDVIATGTPAGVGAGMDPPTFLQPGDEVVCEVAGIGALRNVVA